MTSCVAKKPGRSFLIESLIWDYYAYPVGLQCQIHLTEIIYISGLPLMQRQGSSNRVNTVKQVILLVCSVWQKEAILQALLLVSV